MGTFKRETYDKNGTMISVENIEYDDAPVLQRQALAALDKSDVTVSRINEAVALGLTTLTAPDVVVFMKYRRSLRSVVNTGVGPLPVTPVYPEGT